MGCRIALITEFCMSQWFADTISGDFNKARYSNKCNLVGPLFEWGYLQKHKISIKLRYK